MKMELMTGSVMCQKCFLRTGIFVMGYSHRELDTGHQFDPFPEPDYDSFGPFRVKENTNDNHNV